MDPSRRLFLRRPLSGAAVPPPPRPPWARWPDADFIQACSRCAECIQACPRHLIQPGDGGFPELRLEQQGCNFCGDCLRACQRSFLQAGLRSSPRTGLPLSALQGPATLPAGPLPAPGAFAQKVRISSHCLNQRAVECRACGDACDTRALRFFPRLGGGSRLELRSEACTGCGECLPRCPVNALVREMPGSTGSTG